MLVRVVAEEGTSEDAIAKIVEECDRFDPGNILFEDVGRYTVDRRPEGACHIGKFLDASRDVQLGVPALYLDSPNAPEYGRWPVNLEPVVGEFSNGWNTTLVLARSSFFIFGNEDTPLLICFAGKHGGSFHFDSAHKGLATLVAVPESPQAAAKYVMRELMSARIGDYCSSHYRHQLCLLGDETVDDNGLTTETLDALPDLPCTECTRKYLEVNG